MRNQWHTRRSVLCYLAYAALLGLILWLVLAPAEPKPTSEPAPPVTHTLDMGTVKVAADVDAEADAIKARAAAAERADRAERRAAVTPTPTPAPTYTNPPPDPATGLPALLITIRANESGGDYHAYNPTGCLGGCYGAYQLTGEYMDDWAREAGYPGYAYPGFWPPVIQDAVALYKFNQTGGALWCDWTDYC